MSTKYKLAAILIFLVTAAVFVLFILNNKNKTDKDTVMEVTATPAEERINASETPAQTAAYTPSPESEQQNELIITGIELSNRLGEKKPVIMEETVVFSGYSYLLIHMNSKIMRENIEGHIFVNEEPINPDYIFIHDQQNNTANIFLPGDLPETFTVRISSGITNGLNTLKGDIILNFRHYPEVTCNIRRMDEETGKLLPKSMYIAGARQKFLFEFSVPMDKDSIADSLRISTDGGTRPKYTIEWIDNTRLELNLTNIKTGSYYISIQNAKGAGDIFGSTYSCDYSFSCIKEQRLFKLNPETGRVTVLDEFKQGMHPWSYSPWKDYIVFGIFEEEGHDPIYAHAAYSLKSGELFVLRERFEDAAGKLPAVENDEYFLQSTIINPMIARDEWTNDGHFIYHTFQYVVVMDFNTGNMKVLYVERDEKRLIETVFCLSDGGYAIVEVEDGFTDSEKMYLVIVNEYGIKKGEHLLPFKTQSGEGWIWYYCNVYDTGAGTLVIDGYGTFNGRDWIFNFYELDLANGKLTHLFDIERPVEFFHEKNAWFYRDYNSETGMSVLEYRTLDGEKFITVEEENNRYIRYIAYEPVTDRLFLMSNNSGKEIEIHTFKPDTLEVKTRRIQMEREVEFIGFLHDGELLMLDSIY